MDMQSKIVALVLAFIVLFAVNSELQAAEVQDTFAVYETTAVYDTVTETSCTKGDDKTTEGAILGGIIGAGDGNAVEGAIIGAIIGDLAGEETCTTTTKTVQVGTVSTLTGWNVVIMDDHGNLHTVFLPAN